MLNLEQAPLEVVDRRRDPRMTLPARPGEAPAEGLIGRRSFALAPWIVVCIAALAYAVSEVLRNRGGQLNWPVLAIALSVAVVSLGLVLIQDRPIGLRYRRTLWVYAVLGLSLLALLALVASADTGVASVIYAGAGPVAMYLALVAPPKWRLRLLGALFFATGAVQVANPATAWFDVVIVWSVIVASWACGALVSIGHARTVKIIQRMGGYDSATRSLSRRGFMEQLEFAMAHEPDIDRPIALVLIGVDLAHADEQYGDDGARLLQWIGSAVPAVLPPTAEFGRLGDGELGVLLIDVRRQDAVEIAREIEAVLAVRVPTTVGVATTETRTLLAADLFRVADAARAVAAREGRGLHALVAGTVDRAAPIDEPILEPTLHYADMRATGKVPRIVEELDLSRRILVTSLLLLAAAGLPNIIRTIVDGGDGFAVDLVRYGGGLWLAWVLSIAEVTRRWGGRGYPWVDRLVLVNGALSLPIGVASAGLASGDGLMAAIVAAFFVKTMFDAAIHTRGIATAMFGCVLVGWGVTVALSPPGTLWAAPFQLALFGGCFALGRLARIAMDETAYHARSRAITDDLTQFSNRAGFIHHAEEAFFEAVTATGQPFALITVRLNSLRAHNETYGYASGDELLRTVADLLEDRIPAYYVIGRTGATQFSAAVAVGGAHAASGLAHDLCVAIGAHTSVRAGCATCPADGATLPALMHASEQAAGPRRVAVA